MSLGIQRISSACSGMYEQISQNDDAPLLVDFGCDAESDERERLSGTKTDMMVGKHNVDVITDDEPLIQIVQDTHPDAVKTKCSVLEGNYRLHIQDVVLDLEDDEEQVIDSIEQIIDNDNASILLYRILTTIRNMRSKHLSAQSHNNFEIKIANRRIDCLRYGFIFSDIFIAGALTYIGFAFIFG